MHLVLSEVEKREDLDSALRNILELRGLIATSKQYDKIKDILERALANPKARSWFDGTYKLFNERSILVAGREESSRRPDRVMIKGDTAIVVGSGSVYRSCPYVVGDTAKNECIKFHGISQREK